MIQLREKLITWPQSAYPSGAPTPRKLSVYAQITIDPICIVACTSTGKMQLGRI